MFQYVKKLLNGEKDYIQVYEDFINQYAKSIRVDRDKALKNIAIIGERIEKNNSLVDENE